MASKTTPVKTVQSQAARPKTTQSRAGGGKAGPGKVSPFGFLRQVRAEMLKVTWPSRRETGISTIMVLVMVVLACCFFFLSDLVISTFVRSIIGFLTGIFQ